MYIKISLSSYSNISKVPLSDQDKMKPEGIIKYCTVSF